MVTFQSHPYIDRSTFYAWAALIAAALIAFLLTRGTSYHPLAFAILASTVTLLVALSIFEGVWLAVQAAIDFPDFASKQGGKTL